MTDFERFWQAYPKRNGKKVGKHECGIWFARFKPSSDMVDKMVAWLEIDKNNHRADSKEFYASLPDPIRFLKRVMWDDDIELIKSETKTKTKLWPIRGKFCSKYGCGMPAVWISQGDYPAHYCLADAPKRIREMYC